MSKTDRRIQRTRDLLQKALMDLMRQRGYEAITIQDIADRANVSRTTFYVHYTSKDDLFMSCHDAMISQFHFGPLYPLSREELLSAEAPQGMIAAYQHLDHARSLLSPIFQGRDSLVDLGRLLRDRSAQDIAANLRAAFAEADSTFSIEMLANYLAGAHIGLVQWWLKTRQSPTAEDIANTFHRLQRAAIRDAFALGDDA